MPKFDFLDEYLLQKSTPGGTQRNWDSYGSKIGTITDEMRAILADPQTSGGLLVSVDETYASEFERFAEEKGSRLKPFGRLVSKGENVVNIK